MSLVFMSSPTCSNILTTMSQFSLGGFVRDLDVFDAESEAFSEEWHERLQRCQNGRLTQQIAWSLGLNAF